MYTNQDCDVQWDGAHSNMFKIFNGVKQGSVISRVNSFAIKSFFYTGVKLWNSLPYTTQIITNKQAFKSEVKKVLWLKLIQTNEDIFLFY